MESGKPDILIVGGGPAGLSTWLHLRNEDPALAAATLLIEKAVYPRDKICGGGIIPQADQVLRELGIRLPVPSVLVTRVDYVLGTRRLRASQRFRVVRRREFDHALARVAILRGLALHEREAFETFERIGQSLVIRTNRSRYRVRALVGADGALSSVRRVMNLREGNQRISRALEVVIPSSTERGPNSNSGTATLDFSPVAQGVQGYVWDFPCLLAGMPAHNFGIFDSSVWPAHPAPSLRPMFTQALSKRGTPQKPSTWLGHPGRWFANDGVYAQPNVLLVGDAAGAEPLLGEGISFALRYGKIVAKYLVQSFRRDDLSFADYRQRLLGSPMGITLALQTLAAKDIYQSGPDQMERLYRHLSQQLQAVSVPD